MVIEYASMTCTHCQRFATDVFPEFKKKYIDTGKVYFIFREFPLDPLATAGDHAGPLRAEGPLLPARRPAVRPAGRVGLRRQSRRRRSSTSSSRPASPRKSFNACLTNQKILDGVNWVKDRASKKFGVDSTPTFFINGEKHAGEQSLEDIDKHPRWLGIAVSGQFGR